MKIAVVGCGAVGSFYGAKLARAGHETHFLLRSDYEAVGRNGVCIRSVWGDFSVQLKAAQQADEIGISDLVLIGLKTTANSEFARMVPPLVGQGTAVVTLQNGLGNEEQLAQILPTDQILGGLCFVCLNRVAPGIIHHIAHGQIILGEFAGYPQPRTHELASTFRKAGVPCSVSDNLARAQWEKLTWNIPFNGLGVAAAAGWEAVKSGQVTPGTPLGPCLTTDRLLESERWSGLVRGLMLEVVEAAKAVGCELPQGIIENQIERTLSMGAYKASTLLSFARGRPLELESLFMEPLRRAQHAGAVVPILHRLCEVLSQLERDAMRSQKD